MKTLTLIPALALAGALAACGQSSDPAATTTNASDAKNAPTQPGASPDWLLASMPESVADVAVAKQIASEGDEIVLRGVIGGRVDAMSEDSAVFVMMDANVDNPCLADDDHCPTPWDYCCTPGEQKIANSATVQLVDDDGRPMRLDLRDHGIGPLDTVVVVGSVAPRPSQQVLTVRATKIHRVGG